jgi:hypothetical protein
MSVTGEFARYLGTAIEACSHVQTAVGRELHAALEGAREAAASDLADSALRALAALDEHLASLEASSNSPADEAAAACRDLSTVGRIVLGR